MTTPSAAFAEVPEPLPTDEFAETLNRHRAELEAFLAGQRERLAAAETQLTDRLADVARELSQTQSALRQTQQEQASRAERLAREADDLAQLRQSLEASQAEWRTRQEQAAEAQRTLAEQIQTSQESLARRFDEALGRLAQRQRQWDDAQAAAPLRVGAEDDATRDDVAAEELRQLKADKERLERQLAETRAAGPGADWESQKRRMLAALDDFDEDDEEMAARRLEIETVIRSTNAAVVAKDQEIGELRRLLQQRAEAESPAAPPSAVGQLLDQDAIVQQERDNLRRLQDELQSKLRQAEIEISIERADMARQRMEIEEIMRQFAEESAVLEASRSGDAPEKTSGRRWLTRLGLKKSDDET